MMLTLVTFIIDLIVSVAILYVTYGLMHFVARRVLWLVCSISPFGESACNAPASGVPMAKTRQPSFPEIAVYVRQARDALFDYQRRMRCARSEVREIAARTLETIAQTQALMAQADAIAAGTCCGSNVLLESSPQIRSFARGLARRDLSVPSWSGPLTAFRPSDR
jgi:hypothetical protein